MSRSRRESQPFYPKQLQPGQPGYRTRPGRSGYDPFETRQEAGYVAGVLLRNLARRLMRLFRRRG